MTGRQIAKIVGVNRTRVQAIAERYCIPLAKQNSRRFSQYHSVKRAELIVALAKEAAVSPAVMIDNAVRLLVDDGIEAARKRLGKLAVPKVVYRKQPAGEVLP
ncbi:hypothetical protein OIU35_31705 [Boseaceae bacterium BT-24-1]|nr:hypothetical protein [Boseaceae bacterium BT-24-1]